MTYPEEQFFTETVQSIVKGIENINIAIQKQAQLSDEVNKIAKKLDALSTSLSLVQSIALNNMPTWQ